MSANLTINFNQVASKSTSRCKLCRKAMSTAYGHIWIHSDEHSGIERTNSDLFHKACLEGKTSCPRCAFSTEASIDTGALVRFKAANKDKKGEGKVKFQPVFLEKSVECGLCEETIESSQMAHGHTWSHRVVGTDIELKSCDLFHRTCIQKQAEKNRSCPTCEFPIKNWSDYYSSYFDFDLRYKENSIHYNALKARKDYVGIETLIKSTKGVGICNSEYESAAQSGDDRLLQILLGQSPDPSFLSSCMEVACSNGNATIAKMILEYHRSYSYAENKNSSPWSEAAFWVLLHKAASNKHYDIADLILDEKPFHSAAHWQSVLSTALAYNYPRGVEAARAYPGIYKGSKKTLDRIFSFASSVNNTQVIEELFSSGIHFSPDVIEIAISSSIMHHQEIAHVIAKNVSSLPDYIKQESLRLAKIFAPGSDLYQTLEKIPVA